MDELRDVLEIIKVVAEKTEEAAREHTRADQLAARNIRLTKLVDERLGLGEAEKEQIHKAFGAGLEGRVEMLLHRIEAALELYDTTGPPGPDILTKEALGWQMAEELRGRRGDPE